VDFEFVEKVGTARLSIQHVFPSPYGHKLFSRSKLEGSKCNPASSMFFPFIYGHKLFNKSRLEGSKCNSNFQGSASSTLFLLLMVTSSITKVSLKAQNATQISKAQLQTRFSFLLMVTSSSAEVGLIFHNPTLGEV
jgi:hypothetical protein